jgi:hypothetical protein
MRSKKSGVGLMTHALIIGSIGLSGCADYSRAIQPASSSRSRFDDSANMAETITVSSTPPGVEEYRVFQEGASSVVSIQSLRAHAEKRATEFCARTGKVMKPLRETTAKPGYSLYHTPRIEIIFGCVEKASP